MTDRVMFKLLLSVILLLSCSAEIIEELSPGKQRNETTYEIYSNSAHKQHKIRCHHTTHHLRKFIMQFNSVLAIFPSNNYLTFHDSLALCDSSSALVLLSTPASRTCTHSHHWRCENLFTSPPTTSWRFAIHQRPEAQEVFPSLHINTAVNTWYVISYDKGFTQRQ